MERIDKYTINVIANLSDKPFEPPSFSAFSILAGEGVYSRLSNTERVQKDSAAHSFTVQTTFL
jgi:hypothetical protein